MKRILRAFLPLLLRGGSRKSFTESHRQAADELTRNKAGALMLEKFYEVYVKDKSELEINRIKEEWKRNNSWPAITFNHKILSIRDVESAFNKHVDNNKEQFFEVTLSSMIDARNIYMRLYVLKKDTARLKAGTVFKGYGFSYQMLTEINYITVKAYPVICD